MAMKRTRNFSTPSEGRIFETFNEGENGEPGHGFVEAVVGSRVAEAENLSVGDTITPTHGSADGKAHDQFFIVGVLEPSGTPNDRAVFVNMEGFYLLDGHALPADQIAAREFRNKQYRMLPYSCESVGGERCVTEHAQAVWQPIDQLFELDWAPAEEMVLRAWVKTLEAQRSVAASV